MRVISKERLDPVEYIVRNAEHGIFSKKCAVANAIEGFGEVKSIDGDIRIGFKEIGDSMEDVDKSCSCGACWLESKLIIKTEESKG